MGLLGDLNKKLNEAAAVTRTASRIVSDADELRSKTGTGSDLDAKSVAAALVKDCGARNAAKRLARDAGTLAKKGAELLDK